MVIKGIIKVKIIITLKIVPIKWNYLIRKL